MDLVIILRDALGSSVMGGMLTALEARNAGLEVAVLATQEALAALAAGTFEWPRELAPQRIRFAMCARAAKLGVPVAGSGQGKQLDVRGTVGLAREAGVALLACPIWSALLGLDGRLPEGFVALERAALPGFLTSAKQVIGAL